MPLGKSFALLLGSIVCPDPVGCWYIEILHPLLPRCCLVLFLVLFLVFLLFVSVIFFSFITFSIFISFYPLLYQKVQMFSFQRVFGNFQVPPLSEKLANNLSALLQLYLAIRMNQSTE